MLPVGEPVEGRLNLTVCTDAPRGRLVALINEFAKRSRGRGPVVSPEYYSKLGKIVPDIAEACFEQWAF